MNPYDSVVLSRIRRLGGPGAGGTPVSVEELSPLLRSELMRTAVQASRRLRARGLDESPEAVLALVFEAIGIEGAADPNP